MISWSLLQAESITLLEGEKETDLLTLQLNRIPDMSQGAEQQQHFSGPEPGILSSNCWSLCHDRPGFLTSHSEIDSCQTMTLPWTD